jgi:hypothetical protein
VPYDVSHFSLDQGASTIAEQLAKILYLRGNDHSVLGKAEEIVLGYRLGHRYGREAVLDAYLNSVYLGDGEDPCISPSALPCRRSRPRRSLSAHPSIRSNWQPH